MCKNIVKSCVLKQIWVQKSIKVSSFNQRARDSSSLERTKIQRGIARFLVGFSVFWMSAHLCTLFAHRREGRVFPCIVCILCIVSRACRGEAPPSCWCKIVLSLKSPTGAFIAALRSQTRIFHTFSGEQQAGELAPLFGVHLPDNFQHPFRGDLDAVRQIFFYRRRAGFRGADVL